MLLKKSYNSNKIELQEDTTNSKPLIVASTVSSGKLSTDDVAINTTVTTVAQMRELGQTNIVDEVGEMNHEQDKNVIGESLNPFGKLNWVCPMDHKNGAKTLEHSAGYLHYSASRRYS
uniref:Uncharacterized protein n=1 Tax=Solanum tuberosum TaxID=4113 RepID=M1DRZ4_SOLTU